ncbi:MAG: dipeptidase [Bacteroidetes bacterium QS_9_68_14]|nr:MAG: dipeptidase [Bacteroidetes bacterium QS_9_68_14]
MEDALRYADDHQDRFTGELEELLRIPSISTDPEYADDVQQAANWLASHLRSVGLAGVEVCQTDGHPIVYGEDLRAGEEAPTVLVYGHYDVQPPDPLELWDSPPFEPTRQNGDGHAEAIYARGACDDKGQMFMHVKAAESYLAADGEGGALPVNLKFLIEGEEESGSVHLAPFIEDHKDRLDADVVLISDTGMFAEGVPSITYGLRGLAYVEVTLTGPERDLHSGLFGGAVENPANALARLIAGLHDADHRVAVEGFYDDVQDLTDEERQTFQKLPFDEADWREEISLKESKTEAGYGVLEAVGARPTLDVNGLASGYQGEGAKTVLPAKASAKISCRLVPDQTPDDIAAKLERYFEKHVPSTMRLEFERLHGGQPALIDTESDAMQAAADAMEGVYGRRPFFTREGGTIPVVADFKNLLGLDTVLMGFGLESDAIHSPNEHFGLGRFREGIQSIIRFHQRYAERR